MGPLESNASPFPNRRNVCSLTAWHYREDFYISVKQQACLFWDLSSQNHFRGREAGGTDEEKYIKQRNLLKWHLRAMAGAVTVSAWAPWGNYQGESKYHSTDTTLIPTTAWMFRCVLAIAGKTKYYVYVFTLRSVWLQHVGKHNHTHIVSTVCCRTDITNNDRDGLIPSFSMITYWQQRG